MSQRLWTDEQVAALNRHQERGDVHPYTCPGDHPHCEAQRTLKATPEGWVCACGEYRQTWAHGILPPAAAQEPPKPEQILTAILAATEAAWKDNERRNPYPSAQAFRDLPEQTQQSWIADTRAAIRAYLAERALQEQKRNGQSSRWWALAWELEQITKEPA